MKKFSIQVNDLKYDYSSIHVPCKVVKETPIHRDENRPYLETRLEVVGVLKEYNPNYGDDKICECGHSYYRHFDSYDGMSPVGCKYCRCEVFRPKELQNG